jgi:hypothetical protein
LTAYDWLLVRRTVSLALALAMLVFIVMLGTDDAASTFAGRVGRLAALVSLAGGGAAFIATEQARSRGEMRALAAAGVAPVKASLGAIVGGAIVGAAGPVLVFARGVDLTPLFPRVAPSGKTWVAQDGAWLDAARGVVVRATGELAQVTSPAVREALVEGPIPRLATAVALCVAAVGLPLWATTRSTALRRSAVAIGAAAASVALFHLVAAQRIAAAALVIPPALLVLDAVALHRSSYSARPAARFRSASWR